MESNKRKQILTTKIIIETYGFRSARGDGDKVSVWLKIRFNSQNDDLVLAYPDDFNSSAVIEFNGAKKNPELAFNVLKEATGLVLAKWISTFK